MKFLLSQAAFAVLWFATCSAVSRSQDVVYTLNITSLLSSNTNPNEYYETIQLCDAVEAIVNRNSSRLYVFLTDEDSQWFPFVQDTWLEGRQLVSISNVSSMLEIFKDEIQGIVIYDPQVPATSLLAATMAGMLDLVPLAYTPNRPTSWYMYITQTYAQWPVVHSFVGHFNGSLTGSAKNDAYRWGIKHLIEEPTFGRVCNASVQGYMIDYFWTSVSRNAPMIGNTVPNQDYVMSQRGFFWDLDIWTDQAPNDDPKQKLGTDYDTLVLIMNASNHQLNFDSMIHLVGFVPWAFKYVNKQHPGVATEWELARFLSAFNVFMDADACCLQAMANAAFYQHLPLAKRYSQPVDSIALQTLQSKGYVTSTPSPSVVSRMYISFYVGDYDAAAWLYSQMKAKWDDPARGKVPLGWAVDPELSWRFPVAFAYMLGSMTPNDRIIAGDSGSGYINPTQLLEPRVPSNYSDGSCLWKQHNEPLFQKFDVRLTGFMLQGDAGKLTPEAVSMYQSFSPSGVVAELGDTGVPKVALEDRIPVLVQQDLPQGQTSDLVNAIISKYNSSSSEPQFFVWRSVLQAPPYYQAIAEGLAAAGYGDKIQIVDPEAQALLARSALGGTNEFLVRYVSDDVPSTLTQGVTVSFNVEVFNFGWQNVSAEKTTLCANISTDVQPNRCEQALLTTTCTALPANIEPGDSLHLTARVQAPSQTGKLTVSFGLQDALQGPYHLFSSPAVSYVVEIN